LLAERGMDFDLCFTSVQTRAIKTLNLALEAMGRLWLPVEKTGGSTSAIMAGSPASTRPRPRPRHGDEQVQIWRRSFDIPPPPLEPGAVSTCRRPPLCRHRDSAHREPQGHDRPRPALLGRADRAGARGGQRVLISAHGNSLRALVKHLSNIPDDEITALEIPTGQPIVYELDERLNASRALLSEGSVGPLSSRPQGGKTLEFLDALEIALGATENVLGIVAGKDGGDADRGLEADLATAEIERLVGDEADDRSPVSIAESAVEMVEQDGEAGRRCGRRRSLVRIRPLSSRATWQARHRRRRGRGAR
jgi:2,3-bisphosphoglycerate-dependent phosphoglycerate mutase